ncbi:hypothetical protein SLA_4207 [Streptomyces laurentii]|uniref:Uncharacterized protein n=1 Tax=Streptomyces laurentii TaxID=39478 RepID=A0A160P2X4_STRLU|nr:hypothetical protein SLA_4207 [Streptomyces laurentii]
MAARRDATRAPAPRTMAEFHERQLRKLGCALSGEAGSESTEQGRRPILRFSLDGEAVPGHKVEAGLLGSWLQALQGAVNSVAYARDEMSPRRETGPIPKRIQGVTRLFSGPVFASSYGMVLEGSAVPAQAELPGTGSDLLLDRAINRILDIADQAGASSEAEEAVLDTALPLGRRAISHLSELSDVLASSGTSVSITWESKVTGRRFSRLTKTNAEHCRTALRAAQIEDHREEIRGKLVGGSRLRRFIELEIPGGHVIVIRTEKSDVTQLLAEYAQNRVIVHVHVLTARSPGGREHHSYLLLDLGGDPFPEE